MKLLDPETRALISVGFFRTIDFVMIGGIVFAGITAFYWWIFTHPTLLSMLTVFAGLGVWVGLWVVFLLFRACRFILDIRAILETMPTDVVHSLSNYMLNAGNAQESSAAQE